MLHTKTPIAAAFLSMLLGYCGTAWAQNHVEQRVHRFTLADADTQDELREWTAAPASAPSTQQPAPVSWQDSSLMELQKALLQPEAAFTQQELVAIRQQLLQAQIAVEQRIHAEAAVSATGEPQGGVPTMGGSLTIVGDDNEVRQYRLPEDDEFNPVMETEPGPQSMPERTREEIYRQIRENRGMQ